MLPLRHRLRTVLVALCALLPAVGTARAEPCHVGWERELGGDAEVVRLAGLAEQGGGRVAVGAFVAFPSRGDAEADGADVWRVNPAGEVESLVSLRGPVEIAGASKEPGEAAYLSAFYGLAAGPGESLRGLAEVAGTRVALVEIGAEGSARLSPLELSPEAGFEEVVPLDGGRVVGGGHVADSALAVVVTPEALVARREVAALGRPALFVDVLPAPGEDLVLVANVGDIGPLRMGPSSVLVRRVGPLGDVEAEVRFSGRYGSIAPVGEEGFLLVYDASEDRSQRIRVARLGPDLSLVSETDLTRSSEGYTRFTVEVDPSGRFVVFGARDWNLYVAGIDERGERLWEHESEDERSLVQGVRGLALSGGILAASPFYAEGESGEIRQGIRLTKLVCAPVDANDGAAGEADDGGEG